MNRLRFQPDYSADRCLSNSEDVLIEMIDLRNKWQKVLGHKKSRKWVLLMLMKAGNAETKREALSIYLHLYGADGFIDSHEQTQKKD